MKYKFLVVLAGLSLLAASCNKVTQPGTTNDSNQAQNQQSNNNASQQNPDEQNSQEQATADQGGEAAGADSMAQPEVLEVQMTANGFSPATITINKGDYIQFANVDSQPHWPASNPHPVHTDLPGFDAKQGVAPGAYYRYQFTKVGSWGYHDHLHPSNGGTVIVK